MSTENQHVCPRKFKFFRVLLLGFSTKLVCTSIPACTAKVIPQRLTTYFIKENLTLVTLLSPLGKSWNVRIGSNNLGLQFEEGWERFAAAHKLSFGDLLVFKYVGGTIFHVTIFDKSTCEKDYNITNVNGVDHVQGQGESYDQEYSQCFKGKATSSGQRTPPVMEQEFNKDRTQVPVEKEVQKLVHKANKRTDKHVCKTGSHFEITISSKLKYAVRIPVKFSRSNDLSSINQMLLRDPEGHPWPVKLIHCNQSGFKNDQLLFSVGWRDFRIGNELKNGDVCIFEFKKKNEIFVQIHRSCRDDNSGSKTPLQQAVQLKQAATLQQVGSPSKVTRTCKQADPILHFVSTIVPTNVHKTRYYMTIPTAFHSLVDLSTEKEVVLIDPNSREWPVKIFYHEERRWCRMRNGWEAFCGENDVEVGDVCVFNFKYRGREATFQIEVIKSKTTDGSSRSKSPGLQRAAQLKRASSLQQMGSPSEVTRTSKPADPVQFGSTIVPINVCKRKGYMNIPKGFCSLVDLSAEKEAVLVDPNSRWWPVKIRHCRMDGRCRMDGGGWVRFCGGNNLKVGDVCIFNFEYGSGREVTFQVEVIKS